MVRKEEARRLAVRMLQGNTPCKTWKEVLEFLKREEITPALFTEGVMLCENGMRIEYSPDAIGNVFTVGAIGAIGR